MEAAGELPAVKAAQRRFARRRPDVRTGAEARRAETGLRRNLIRRKKGKNDAHWSSPRFVKNKDGTKPMDGQLKINCDD
ncbi:hypothetical protein [Methylocella sp.]|uniref:hypothetical protein n=1 Tax=Methylocella sp. TaxID=1978226 RepID=UPI003784ADD2